MKRPFRAKSVNDSLDNPTQGHLKSLLEKAKNLNSVSQTIEIYLPQELQEHCKVGNIIDNVLTLYAKSPHWASRLRYCSTQLLTELRSNQYPSLISINIKVRPDLAK